MWKAPQLEDLPPLHGGIMGYLGYDVVREVEHLPDVPPDDQGHPDAMVSVIGQLAAYDHWRQRATLIENVLVEPGLGDDELDRRYDDAVARLDELAADGARPLDEPLLDPPDPDDPLPDVRSVMGKAERTARRWRSRKEHILAGDIFQVVLAQRFDLDLDAHPFDVYRVLRQVNPSPYMYFVRQPGVTLVGSSPEPMVQLLGRHGDLATDRRHALPRSHRRGGPAPGGRAHRAPEGDRRAHHAGRPGPQRRRARRRVRHRDASTR